MIDLAPLVLASANIEFEVVTFQFVKEGIPLIMLPIEIDGKGPYSFILDTGNGAAPLLLSKALSASLQLKTEPLRLGEQAFGVGSQGIGEVDTAVLGEARLGGIRRRNVQALVTTALESLAEKLQSKIDGNIGYGFLKDFAVTVDYKAMKLELRSNPKKRPGVPFKLAKDPLILVQVEANGRPFSFILDTGAGVTCLSGRAAKALGLSLGQEVPFTGAAGSEPGHMSKLESLRVGRKTVRGLEVMVGEFFDELEQKVGGTIDGIVGYNFLRNYRVVIDYPNGILSLDDPEA